MVKPNHADDYNLAQDCLENKNIDTFMEKHESYIKNLVRKRLDYNLLTHLEDIIQEIFTLLFARKAFNGYKGESSLKTWLYVLVSRRTINEIEKIKRKRHLTLESIELDPPAKSTDTSTLVNDIIEKMKKEWDYEKTTMMYMHYYESMTYNQIGVFFQIGESTISYHIKIAKQKFKKLYSK